MHNFALQVAIIEGWALKNLPEVVSVLAAKMETDRTEIIITGVNFYFSLDLALIFILSFTGLLNH